MKNGTNNLKSYIKSNRRYIYLEGWKRGREEGKKKRREGRESRSAPLSVSFDSQKIFLRKNFGNIKRAINTFFPQRDF